jgi:hypothetical protein
MCVLFCDDIVILNLPCNPLEKMTRKYVTNHWQMRSKGVNGKVNVKFEDCNDVKVVHCKGPWGVCIAVVL